MLCKKTKQKEYTKKWRAANPDKVNAMARKWRAANPEKVAAYKRKSNYKITTKEYNNLVVQQKSKCATCPNVNKKLHVDHCHETGKVRGLLCSNCNTALGLVKENISTLTNLISYIANNP